MRVGIRLGALAVLIAALLAPAPTNAHVIDPSSVDQSLTLRVDEAGFTLAIRVAHGELHALPLLRAADLAGDRNGVASPEEIRASALPFCARYLETLEFSLYGEPFGVTPLSATISSRIESATVGLYQLDCLASVGVGVSPVPDGSKLELASRYLESEPGLRRYAIDYARAPAGYAEVSGRDTKTRLSVRIGEWETISSNEEGKGPGSFESLLPALPVGVPVDLVGGFIALTFAFIVGALHALTPGHGKALISAALIGRRASPGRALLLGLSVSLSHTIGVLLMALLVLLFASSAVSSITRLLPLAAALVMVAIALSMLRTARREESGHRHDHVHGADHAHDGEAFPLSTRALVALGLSGGIVPSASALVVLIGAIASGATAWGVLVVISFGAGMALVMSVVAIGAGRLGARLDRATGLGHTLAHRLPLASAVLVLTLALALTAGALGSL